MKSINFVVPAKNVVLGGVKSVTLHDDRNVEITDLSSQVSIGNRNKTSTLLFIYLFITNFAL